MKKIMAVLIAVTLSVVLCSCAYMNVESAIPERESKPTSMFVAVEQTGTWAIVYHKETKVMYAISTGGYNGGNFTVLVNPDGTPMIWIE